MSSPKQMSTLVGMGVRRHIVRARSVSKASRFVALPYILLDIPGKTAAPARGSSAIRTPSVGAPNFHHLNHRSRKRRTSSSSRKTSGRRSRRIRFRWISMWSRHQQTHLGTWTFTSGWCGSAGRRRAISVCHFLTWKASSPSLANRRICGSGISAGKSSSGLRSFNKSGQSARPASCRRNLFFDLGSHGCQISTICCAMANFLLVTEFAQDT
jgi:hypothetical protein